MPLAATAACASRQHCRVNIAGEGVEGEARCSQAGPAANTVGGPFVGTSSPRGPVPACSHRQPSRLGLGSSHEFWADGRRPTECRLLR
jgi:hypothetical protein